MRILALETSQTTASVAILEDDRAIAVTKIDEPGALARELAPRLNSLLAEAGWKPNDVELVAVSIGPGSFTGLRIGVTTAKTFAYAVGSKLVSVPTLDAAAWRCRPVALPPPVQSTAIEGKRELWIATNAHRNQSFATRYELRGFEEGNIPQAIWIAKSPVAIYSHEELKQSLVGEPFLAGSFAMKLSEDWASATESPRVIKLGNIDADAESTGQLGLRLARMGGFADPFQLVPLYLLLSAAEEKALEDDAAKR